MTYKIIGDDFDLSVLKYSNTGVSGTKINSNCRSLCHFKCMKLPEKKNSLQLILHRCVINSKAGKAAALPKFSDTLTPSQPRGADYAHPLALLGLKNSMITPLLQFKFIKFKIENIIYLVRDINSPIHDFFIKIVIYLLFFSGLKSSHLF